MSSKSKSNAATPINTTGSESRPLSTNESSLAEVLCDPNIAMHCVLKDSVERLNKCFEDEEDPYKESVNDLMIERNDDGKSPLDMACTLGRSNMIRELITRGVDPNATTAKGYTPLHLAAAWGKIDCLKILVESECNIQLRTAQGERAREVALRYDQAECVDYLDWAEAKQELQLCVKMMRETLADPEKIQGRLSREEKKTTEQLCNEKDQWIETTTEVTTHDFITKKQEFEEACEPIWQKINEPLPEKEVKK